MAGIDADDAVDVPAIDDTAASNGDDPVADRVGGASGGPAAPAVRRADQARPVRNQGTGGAGTAPGSGADDDVQEPMVGDVESGRLTAAERRVAAGRVRRDHLVATMRLRLQKRRPDFSSASGVSRAGTAAIRGDTSDSDSA